MADKPLRYLALGDSYTIGEGVPLAQGWPAGLAGELRKDDVRWPEPEIIAATGWTTDELLAAIDEAAPQAGYTLVSLLIGVNNQYRGYPLDRYRKDLVALLDRTDGLLQTGGKLLVVSIPDWGVTRFAEGRDCALIAREINVYNETARVLAGRLDVPLVDITGISRDCGAAPAMLVDDGLHPSADQYRRWLPPIAAAARSATSQEGRL